MKNTITETTKHFIVALYYYYQDNPIFNVHRAKAMKSVQPYLEQINFELEQINFEKKILSWDPSVRFLNTRSRD
jgi:hypothetical protein